MKIHLTAGHLSSSTHKRDVHAGTYSNQCPPQGSVSNVFNYEVYTHFNNIPIHI